MCGGIAWPYRVRMVKNATLSKGIVDVLVALAFLAAGWLSTGAPTISDPFYRYTPRDWLFVVLLILATVPYAGRRRWPTVAFLVSMLSVTVLWLLGYNAGALPLLLMFGGYFVAVARPTWELVLCSAVAIGCFALLWWAGGAPYGARDALISVLALANTVGHCRAGRHRVDHAIAQISRSSLDEVRAVVAALRDDEPSYRPPPSLTDLPDLVETLRATGLKVELTLPDDIDAVPRQTGAAVYRITREALTNVLRHAGASKASVQVDHHDGRVEVAIRDDGAGAGDGHRSDSGTGHGIAGMRERAEALGGSLSAGPSSDGGFLVSASLPVGSDRSR